MIEPGAHQFKVVEKFHGVPAAIIGDSMGTGKTISAILRDFDLRVDNPGLFRTLIVCQKGGLAVWKWHLLDQGVPEDRILVVDPQNRDRFDLELSYGALNYDYYITHWDSLIRLKHILKTEGRAATIWHHLIGDEVQYAKNRRTKRTKVFKAIKAKYKTGASGTPADDKPQDFWSILNWCYPKEPKLRSYWKFYDHYLEWYTHPVNGYRIVKGTKNMPEFHSLIAPFYIRRKLTDVVDDMPPKIRSKLWVDLTTRQRKDYDAMHEFQRAHIGERREELLVIYLVTMHVRLQQMTLGTTALDWTRFNQMWEKYGHLDPEQWPKTMPTGPRVQIGEPSPKIDVVMEKIDSAMDAGENIVVFSQFRDVVNLIEARCQKEKYPVGKVTGEVTRQSTRDAIVADFQSRKLRVFCGTIGAAGTSITLTAANTVIFTDRKWNPSANEQAEDRIWRIGQTQICQIIDVVSNDTIDEDRLKRIWQKARYIEEIINLPIHLRDV